MNISRNQNHLTRWQGHLLIPHELLHILGYRLVGKRCEYRWGQSYVAPIGSISRREYLVGTLFPFVVFMTLVIVFGLLAGFTSTQAIREHKVFWFILWLTLTYVAGLYTGTTLVDLRKAYALITDQPWPGRQPVDWLLHPVVMWYENWEKVTLEKGVCA